MEDGPVIVADLAEELGVPPQQLVATAKAAGLAVVWSGSELTDGDVATLRAAAGTGTTSVSPSDAHPQGGPVPDGGPPVARDVGPALRAPEPRSASDPTTATEVLAPAVADPDLVAGSGEPATVVVPTAAEATEDRSDVDHDLPPNVVASVEGGLAPGIEEAAPSPGVAPPPAPAEGTVPPRPVRTPVEPRLDRSIRPSVVALVTAVLALVVANVLVAAASWAAALLLLVAVVATVVLVIDANRARYHITTHPDRDKGLAAAVSLLVVGVVGLVTLGAMAWAIFVPTRASSGPLATVTRQHLVEDLRWSRQRLWLVADHGWKTPAKEAGDCYAAVDPTKPGDARQADEPGRIEAGGKRVPCAQEHRFQVLATRSLGTTPDAPYPGRPRVEAEARARCRPLFRAALLARAGQERRTAPPPYRLVVDLPRRANWDDADHDVACLADAGGITRDELPTP